MKKFIPLAALFISLVFSSACFAEWILVEKNFYGDLYYIDFDRIKIKNKRAVFFWELINYAKPNKYGTLSAKDFKEADCGIPRKTRSLAESYYPQPMAQGSPSVSGSKPQEWQYPQPGSVMETILNKVCALAKKK
jgi:hypothetical protein